MFAELAGATVLEGSASTEVVVYGELDVTTLSWLRTALKAVCADQSDDLVVNLEQVAFCDIRVIGLLVVTAARLRGSGRRLIVRGDPPRRSRIFRRYGLEHLHTPA